MHERAVVNAGPLVALSLLGRLDLLPSMFREVWIPEVVQQEVCAGLGVRAQASCGVRNGWPG